MGNEDTPKSATGIELSADLRARIEASQGRRSALAGAPISLGATIRALIEAGLRAEQGSQPEGEAAP